MSESEESPVKDKTNIRRPENAPLEDVVHGDDHTTIYDPYNCYTAWMTVPDSLWCEVEQ